MQHRKGVSVAAIAIMVALFALAADKASTGDRNTGSTTLRPPVALDTKAMNAMLRADRNKDGTLSREELEHYDMTLGGRFRDVDGDRDGKLTLYEFEMLLEAPQESASRR
jgi:hypothetical protein